MKRISGIYVPIKGNYAGLRDDMEKAKGIVTNAAWGMSNALNNAFSPGKIKSSINTLIDSLGTLTRSQGLVKDSFQSVGIALGDLQRLTGTTGGEFLRLQQRMLETQAARAQENALRSVSSAIGATRQEIKEMGLQYGLSEAQIQKVTTALHGQTAELKVVASLSQSAQSKSFAGATGQFASFADDLITLSQGSKIAEAALARLGTDMEELRSHTGLTAEQFSVLKARFSANQAEEAQAASLTNIANSLRLSRTEIASFGQQMGASTAVIHDVTTAIHGTEAAMSSLALQANAGIFSGFQSQATAFVADITSLANGSRLAQAAMDSLKVDMDALGKTAGFTAEQIAALKTRFSANQSEEAQIASLTNIANSLRLSRSEIASFGQQMGASSAVIHNVTTAIHGAEAAMSSLALQANAGIFSGFQSQAAAFVADITSLANGSKLAQAAMDSLQADMDALSKTTGFTAEQITALKSRFSANQSEEAQAASLTNIANSLRLSRSEIASFGQQMGVSTAVIHDVTTAIHGAEAAISSLALKANAGIFSGLQTQAGTFFTNITSLVNGTKLAKAAMDSLQADMDALSKTTGHTAEQVIVLKTRFSNNQAEEAQIASLTNIANSLRLSRSEIASFGQQLGVSSAVIHDVTVAIHGAEAAISSLALQANAGIFSGFQSQAAAFATDITSLVNGTKLAKAAMDSLQGDMDALSKTTGHTAEQITILKTRFSGNQAEEAQIASLTNIANSLRLSRSEIAAFGQQMGASAAVIHDVTVAIHGAEAAISSLALQANAGIFSGFQSQASSFAADIAMLANGSKLAGAAMDSLAADLEVVRKQSGLTEEQFAKMTGQFSQIQGEKAKETALSNIANSLRLSRTEIAAFGQQMGASTAVIHNVTAAIHGAEAAISSLALQANAGIFSGFQSQASAFVTDIISLANGAKLAGAAMDSLQADMAALGKTAGLAADQVAIFKSRFSANQAEEAQTASLTNIANALRLSRSEIASFGQQMGASTAVIHNVTAAIHGAEAAISSLALKANAGIFSGFQTQASAFVTDIISLANGSKLAGAAMDSLKADLDALSKTTGHTAEQIAALKTRFSANQGEDAQVASLTNIANSLRLSRSEIAAFGQQMGASAAVIHNVTVAIHGAEAAISSLALKANAGIFSGFQSQAAAFSTDLATLANGSKLVESAMDSLAADLEVVRRQSGMTKAEFAKLKGQFLQTQGEKAQETALKNIATAARYTEKEMRQLGRQMGLTPESIKRVAAEMNHLGKSTEFSMMKFKDMIITVGIYTIAFTALSAAMAGLKKGIFDFNAQMEVSELGIASAFLSTGKYIDEQTGKILEGEAAFKASQIEAKSIIEELKIANLSTIATLEQLVRAYQETLPVAMRVGFNKSQVQEFTTAMIQAAGAIDASGALMYQLGEETRALLTGAINDRTSRIAKILGVAPDDVKQFKNDAEGLFNFLMDKLAAYKMAGIALQSTWKGLASNAIDLVTQIAAMVGEPIFEAVKADLKSIVESIYVMDETTKQMKISDDFLQGIEDIKRGVGEVIASFRYLGIFIDATGYALADFAARWSFSDESQKTFRKWADKLLKDAQEQDKKLQELYNRMEGLNSDGTKKETSTKAKYVPNKGTEEPENHNNDYNSMLRARLDYLKAEEEKGLALVRAANELMQQENEHAYELGLTSYQDYLDKKNKLTENQLKADLEAKQQELKNAEEALAKIKPVTDKDGDARPEKDQKNYYDALKRNEKAEKDVMEAANRLRQAQSEGAHKATLATIENERAYQELNIQLLEMTGQYKEAAIAREKFEKGSEEYKRLQEAANKADKDGIIAKQRINVLDKIRLQQDQEIALNHEKDAKQYAIALTEITGEYDKQRQLQMELLDIEIKLATLQGKSPEQVEYLRAERVEIEKMTTAAGAFARGWRDATKEWADEARRMENLAEDIAYAMHSSFEDLFFDALQGDMKSFMDYFKSFLTSLNRALAKFWADWLVGSMTNSSSGGGGWLTWITKLFSAGAGAASGGGGGNALVDNPKMNWGGRHGGGIVGVDKPTFERSLPVAMVADAPRLHTGLMADEYPAILKRGESVFTPGQLEALHQHMVGRDQWGRGEKAGDSITINVPVTAEDKSRRWTKELKHEIEDVVERYMRRQLA